MKFSVLMSLYGREKPGNLDQCLESIKGQTVQANEIIIVYDGPLSEQLCRIVDGWSEVLPITVVKLKDNVGLGKALKIGLNICTNELVARMDTDDICDHSRFSKQLAEFQEHSDLVICGSNIDEYSETMEEIISSRNVPVNTGSIVLYARFRNPFNHMTVMYKKEKILEVGGYIDHAFMEDYNLWLRLIKNKVEMKNIALPLVKARAGYSMLGRRRGIKYISSEIKLLRLKNDVYGNNIYVAVYSLMRCFSRLLPISVLRKVYEFSRN
jgi:glycosyltransferase involved in cell wall biosynthesis